jgi:hypothetical protein
VTGNSEYGSSTRAGYGKRSIHDWQIRAGRRSAPPHLPITINGGSTTAQVGIWIAGASKDGPWLLSVDREEVCAEFHVPSAADSSGPGVATFVFGTLQALYGALDRIYRLGVSLPDAPLKAFQAAACDLPRTTEAERLVVQRVGQDLFRQALLAYWGGRCPMTGITNPELYELRISSRGPARRSPI